MTKTIANLSSEEIFVSSSEPIGIGAIAVSAIFGIIRMGKIVLGSISLGFKGLKGGGWRRPRARRPNVSPQRVVHPSRLDASDGPPVLRGGDRPAAILPPARLLGRPKPWYAVVGAVVGFALSFLFTPVAAQAIAIVGVNPVSGMTLITVVLTILALVETGLTGRRDVHRTDRRLRGLHRVVHVGRVYFRFQDRLLDRHRRPVARNDGSSPALSWRLW